MNRQWFGRLQSEVNVASEFASKLRTVRSISDTEMVCQEWMSRRFDRMTDDGERLFADIQKFMEAGSRLMANGSRSGGPDPGSTLSTQASWSMMPGRRHRVREPQNSPAPRLLWKPTQTSSRRKMMSKFALYVPLEAKPGKEKEVADFLRSAVPLVNAEAGTISWFAVQEGPSSFAIFDSFDDESGRDAHLKGRVAAALMEKAKAGDLFAKMPEIHKLEILADKLPK